jgi:DNA-directed RNA polymerase specialized sigma24 family protein
MTPAEPEIPEQADDNSPDIPHRRTTHARWTLTQQAFDKLLVHFSPNREEAGQQYESVHLKLVRYFQKQSIDSAENRADVVMNRVARRIDEGIQIDNVPAYAFRVAYLVFLEALKEPAHAEIDAATGPAIQIQPEFEDPEQDPRLHCFDLCLEKLSGEQRGLILHYYREEGQSKIQLRKRLADRLKISLDALRIRAHRIRKSLEECITKCLGQTA